MTRADPVAAITEAEATGETAALYAQIRGVLGVPVVNLIWRHLATIPNGLPWAWESLRPLYADGTIEDEASALRSQLTLPSGENFASPMTQRTLSANERMRIDTILASYERSNAMNLIALAALKAKLAGTVLAQPHTVSATRERATPIDAQMPEALSVNEMDPATATLVENLNRLGARGAIVPTMYRHLAHWPSFLEHLLGLLEPLDATGFIESAILDVVEQSTQRGQAIATRLAVPHTSLDDAAQVTVRAAVETFRLGPLPKMTAIVAIITSAMPNRTSDRTL